MPAFFPFLIDILIILIFEFLVEMDEDELSEEEEHDDEE
jgi:hypothetical protein